MFTLLQMCQVKRLCNGYRVFLKKVFHKCQEEMQEKMKVALQKDKTLVQQQQQQQYTMYYIV